MAKILDSSLVIQTDRRFLSKEEPTDEQLKILNVDPKWATFIRLVDQKGSLMLFHYLTTNETAIGPVNEQILTQIGHVRGTIIDESTGKIVCQSLPYTPEILTTNLEKLDSPESCYPACEGTVLRLFWYGDKWHISTHRKIDAYNSFWANSTFGQLFTELKEFDFEELNKNFCYVLLMSHGSNRLVYPVSKGQLMLIALYNCKEAQFIKFGDWGAMPKGIVAPAPVKAKNVDDIKEIVNKMVDCQRFDNVGLIVFTKEDGKTPRLVKVLDSSYVKLRDLRGNDPQLSSRYLQIRNSPDGGLLVMWYKEPENQKIFEAVEKDIELLAVKLHGMYVHRFIHKNFETLPKEEFITIQRCHSWHVQNRKVNIVTLNKVKEILNDTQSYYIQIMLNRMKQIVE